ncbi:P-loop containing nucleoside triphosphate hydrolase protein [Limtongia smithiae]|uniref:P-loop containing nucleoside triphosphate hydrolase protein n=1 Tax=Limtongia smithiae TaxID=1125753 RepID=UPI0034CFAAB8
MDPSTEVVAKLTKRFKSALRKEREEDISQTQAQIASLPPKGLARRGLAILNVVVSDVRTALGGTAEISLVPDNAISQEIDKNIRIRTGDIVAVERIPSATEKKSKITTTATSRVEGVVVRISQKSIHVTLDDKFTEKAMALDGRLWIVKLANSVTYTRMDENMEALSKLKSPTRLQSIVLGVTKPSTPTQPEKDVKWFDNSLNKSQKQAVSKSIGDSEVTIVHGPPGTGKTYTVIEIIRQLVEQGKRVLVCGPSNISVDTILERLHGLIPTTQLLRVGHPARILQSTQQHSLDLILRSSEPGQIVKDIRSEIDDSFMKLKKARSGYERSEIYKNIKLLRKEYRLRERKALTQLLTQATVIASTLHGAGSTFLSAIQFNTIIIDEVSQSLEPQCWIPLLAHPEAERLIIAGDNKQLPPTIKFANNEQVLGTTLFDRLESLHGEKVKTLLNVQYRMNTKIMDYPSKAMYNGELTAAKSVADQTLADLEYIEQTEDTEVQVLWIDTQGGDFNESVSDEGSNMNADSTSKSNDLEAWIVIEQISNLLNCGVKLSDIGVISPYNAQVALISQRFEAFSERSKLDIGKEEILEISSVDGFQGREKEAIIISMVRSNDSGKVGFLKDDRRLNVAMTRPRRYLCVIGDSETLSRGSKFLKNWVDWAMDNAEIQYPDVGDTLELAMRCS